jgi:hypothetical protein
MRSRSMPKRNSSIKLGISCRVKQWRGPASNDADVSIASPKSPYGEVSPIRLQGRMSDEAVPAHWFAIILRALCCHRDSLLCVRDDALISTSLRADLPLYPRGPRSGPGYAVPVHPHLTGPIRPTRRHIPTSPFSRLIRDAFAVHIRICLGDLRLVLSFH